jgi:hypothetical protein
MKGYAGALEFSSTGIPQNATCGFQPATVTVSGTRACSLDVAIEWMWRREFLDPIDCTKYTKYACDSRGNLNREDRGG